MLTRYDTIRSILGIEIKESSGQNVTRQWIADPLAVIQSHQHLAVLFAPRFDISPELSILFLAGREFFLSQRSSPTAPPPPSLSPLRLSPLSPKHAAGRIHLVINLAEVTLITAEFYLSRLASTSRSIASFSLLAFSRLSLY